MSILWSPPPHVENDANLSHYIKWLRDEKGRPFSDYSELWEWSTTQASAFWESLWQYFDIIHDGSYNQVMNDEPMPFTKWFTGTRLNYAEHIFRHETTAHPAIIFGTENGAIVELSWTGLREQTAIIQGVLRDTGIVAGDCIAGFLPCIPEATTAFLATNSLGGIWASCSPDFGMQAVLDRFIQIEPKVLFTVTDYRYNGKTFDKSDVVSALIEKIPSIRLVINISESRLSETRVPVKMWRDLLLKKQTSELHFTRVPFEHPIWVLFSSGTTGLPKAITHSNGGILLEQLKYCTFHNDFKNGERCFWYTTTGWMMWNYIHGSLLCGGTMVIYNGSPAYPDLNALWKFSSQAQIQHFGTSAGFILANIKESIEPSMHNDLSSLRSIGSTGSTLPLEGFEWVYQHVKKDIWLTSMSGGTDVCSAFVGGNPLLPVHAGEIQCRALGSRVEAWDEHGVSVMDQEGEMVITVPMPSMPVFFWNDPDFSRYKESYFEMYPGVWRHGDWIRITHNDGVIIYGRSDATLNRGGIRIGTSEIYRAVDQVEEVQDSLIVCIEREGGEFWMPLFVKMKDQRILDDAVRKKINTAIRQANSPRHVPDEIISIPEIPYTISGKKTETPVKKILMGKEISRVANRDSLKNPSSLEIFLKWAPSPGNHI